MLGDSGGPVVRLLELERIGGPMSSESERGDGRQFRMWMRPDGVVQLVWATGAVMTLEAARDAIDTMTAITGGRPTPLLVDSHDAGPQLRPARKEFVRRGDLASAVALMVSTPLSRMMGNFFLSVNKPAAPTRLFEDESSAVEWLKGFVA